MILQVRVSGLWGSYGFQEQCHVIEVDSLSASTTQRWMLCAEKRTSENSTFTPDSGSKPCALYKLLRFSHVQFEVLNFRIHHFYPLLSSRIITLVFQKPSRTYQIRRCLEHLETLLKRCLGVRTLPSKERLEDYRKFYPYFCAVFLIHRSHLFTPGSLTYPVHGTRANIGWFWRISGE